MTTQLPKRRFTRRGFFKLAGGALAAAAGAYALPKVFGRWLGPSGLASAQAAVPDLVFAGTDGWISLPATPAMPPYHPDSLAPAPFTTYIFGFHNVTGLTEAQRLNQKMKAQHPAPLFWVNQDAEFRLQLHNLGLQMRPDLTDAHTVHWHGFRNVIPFFDGEPTGSLAVPMGQNFTYVYRPREPGTYMFHCHVEDIEHVHMGMTGMTFVRPAQDGNTALYPSGRYVYNDGDGSTGFDREFSMLLTEVWNEAHWDDAHIQLPEWTDYRADFCLLNGRVYPDTIAPNSPLGAPPSGTVSYLPFATDPVSGDLLTTPGYEYLQYQPISSLVNCNAGERVLLRFANLGFKEQAMTLAGIKMQVVGRDATLLRGRDGTSTAFATDTVSLHAGESYDVIVTAPPYVGPGPYDTYLLYNRKYSAVSNLVAGGHGGQMTEVRVYPPGTLAPQTLPNT